jgi:hypothetical protein
MHGTYGDAEHGQHNAVGQEGFEGDTHLEDWAWVPCCAVEDWVVVSSMLRLIAERILKLKRSSKLTLQKLMLRHLRVE